jgi:protein SCO1/2
MKLAPLMAGVLAIALAIVPTSAHAGPDDPVVPKELKHVNVDEHLDGQVPLDLTFRDHTGKPVRLGQLVDGKRPIVLTFAYHTCPVICSMFLNGVATSLSSVGWTAGKEFEAITISIDPKDSLERTAAKRASILGIYKRPQAESGWSFLLGDEASIKRATDSVGYQYQYDAEQQQYAHPAVLMILKPNGRVSRYLYGLEFPANDLKLALIEASEGKSVSTVDKVIMYCYRYDPKDGKYVVVATRVMQVGGGLTALVLGLFLGTFWLRERKKSRAEKILHSATPAEATK